MAVTRIDARLVWSLFLAAVVSLVWGGQALAEDAENPPAGIVPSIHGHFTPIDQGTLNGDPNFPVIVLRNTTDTFPRVMMVVVDARQENDTWSLARDPAVFVLMMGDDPANQQAFLDRGFADGATPTGEFLAAGADGIDALMARLVEAHQHLAETSAAASSQF